MGSEQIVTFLFGAGSATTVVGTIMIYRIKKMWENLDEIPLLIKATKNLKTSVDSFSGEMKSIERQIYHNQKEIAVTEQKVTAAFREIDTIKRNIEL